MPESTWERLVEERKRRFLHRGMLFAGVSGISYGLYTAFLTLAQTQGVWGEWISGSAWGMGNPALSAFTVTFALAALAAAINDLFSGVWSVLVCAKNGQLNDLLMTIRSKPGIVMMACSAIGGPIATIAYVVALNAAAASGNPGVIVPIAALNCAIGTVLGQLLLDARQGVADGHSLDLASQRRSQLAALGQKLKAHVGYLPVLNFAIYKYIIHTSVLLSH